MTTRTTPWFVAIGASGAQGLDDIRALLAALPVSLPAVLLVVLHRAWDRPTNLQAVLARSCRHPIEIAETGRKFEPGTVYIGEPSQHLTLAARSFGVLVEDAARHYRNRTVDLLFRTVAEHGNRRVIGVVLSGALDDGSRGLSVIHETGGLTMVLTPGAERGMPENAIAFDGPVDVIGDARRIAAAIVTAIQGA